MGFSRAVIANYKKPFIVYGLVKLKLWDSETDKPFSHLYGDDIGLDKLPGGGGRISAP
jgi:hypothetical protein